MAEITGMFSPFSEAAAFFPWPLYEFGYLILRLTNDMELVAVVVAVVLAGWLKTIGFLCPDEHFISY